jgi:XrtJ-associated TM-motif-TM protein
MKKILKSALSLSVVLLAFAVVAPAFGQSGGVDNCKNSPENPTALLAVIGSAGGGLMTLRSRLRRK